MSVVSRARLLSERNILAAAVLARKIFTGEFSIADCEVNPDDPLLQVVPGDQVAPLRSIEARIREHLVGSAAPRGAAVDACELSEIAAFFYLCLFRLARQMRRNFTSNPTWVKRSRDSIKALPYQGIFSQYIQAMEKLANSTARDCLSRAESGSVDLIVGDSCSKYRWEADLILTSPPYCTRIDYAVATSTELAILGFSQADQRALRERLMGTTAIAASSIAPSVSWGSTANRFLDRVRAHPSKASASYYYRNHLQYFDSLSRSMGSISESLRRGGIAIIVVQDSFYKEVHNDLASVCEEMAEISGLDCLRREVFEKTVHLRRLHPSRSIYDRGNPVESVLCFRKG